MTLKHKEIIEPVNFNDEPMEEKNRMKELTVGDLHLVVTRLPKDIRKICKDEGVIVGGGFIRETIAGGQVKDIDIFGPDKRELKKVAHRLTDKRDARDYETDNAITVLSHGRIPIQFITRWTFETLQECVESFDFTVCQAAIQYDRPSNTWKSCVHENFYSDLAAKRLMYTHPRRDEEAGGSIMRVVKFLRRGYNIQTQSLAGVMSRLAAKLDERARGDEEEIARVFKGLLIEVDPMEIVDGIEVVENEHL